MIRFLINILVSVGLIASSPLTYADECTKSETFTPIAVDEAQNEIGDLTATKAYFVKILGYIKRVRDFEAQNTGERASINGTYARLIDEMPTLTVDKELVDFGVRISQALRGNMVTLQQINISMAEAKVVNNAGVPVVGVSAGYYGGYFGGVYYSRPGYYYDQSNAPYKYDAVAAAQGYFYYRAVIAKIDEAVGLIRRRMTDKFQVQF